MPSKSCPAPTAAAKWARPRASTPRKISAPTTLSPPTKTTTNASSANLDECFIDTRHAGVRSSFQHALIPDAGRASIAFNLIGVHGQHFGHGQVVGHRASFLYNGPYFSWLARYAPITWERGLAFLCFSMRSASASSTRACSWRPSWSASARTSLKILELTWVANFSRVCDMKVLLSAKSW